MNPSEEFLSLRFNFSTKNGLLNHEEVLLRDQFLDLEIPLVEFIAHSFEVCDNTTMKQKLEITDMNKADYD